MLPNYRPAKVAEMFNLLALLFPGRLDLGVGFAAGASPEVASRLRPKGNGEAAENFAQLLALLDESAELTGNPNRIEPWILATGTGIGSDMALQHRVGIVCAQFFNPHVLEDLIREFPCRFRSQWAEKPNITLALDIISGPDRASVRKNLQYRTLHSARMRQRKDNLPFPADLKGLSVFTSAEWEEAVSSVRRNRLIGTYEEIAQELATIAHEYGIGEFMFHLYSADLRERTGMIEGLARACETFQKDRGIA